MITDLTSDWGNRLLEGTDKTLCLPGPRRKVQWSHKRLSQTCLWVSRILQLRGGLTVAWCGIKGTECNSPGISLFEGGNHYLYHSLASDLTTGRENSPANQHKIGLRFAEYVSTHQSRTQINNYRKLTKLIPWITALYDSVKLWAMWFGVNQHGWVMVEFSSVQSLSLVWLFVTPWIAAHQASLSITNSHSSPRLTSIEAVMPSSHLILYRPLLLLPPIPPSIKVFSNESTLCMRWPK